MNKIFSLILIVFVTVVRCSPDDATPTAPANDDFDPANATLLRSGTFMGRNGHSVMGEAKIYNDDGKHVLVLDNYTSSNGPDLKVYISTTTNADAFINLGDLKSVSGRQVYAIPGTPDYSQYPYVLVWCQQFSVLFGEAQTMQ